MAKLQVAMAMKMYKFAYICGATEYVVNTKIWKETYSWYNDNLVDLYCLFITKLQVWEYHSTLGISQYLCQVHRLWSYDLMAV